jgi:uncharacterized protein GlcG (DUF336 family)
MYKILQGICNTREASSVTILPVTLPDTSVVRRFPTITYFTKQMMQTSTHLTDLNSETAAAMLDAAIQKSIELGVKMNIAVVDAGANLKAFHRMDGAWLGSVDIACKKAKTARFFDMPTGSIGDISQPGGPLYNIEHSNGGLISFPGGLPLTNEQGTVIGAIGVSGSTVENDRLVAQ